MESGRVRSGKSLRLAVLISLLLHAAVLLVDFSSSGPASGPAAKGNNGRGAARPRLFATLTKPTPSLRKVPLPPRREARSARKAETPAESSESQTGQRQLSSPTGPWATRSWSNAEREEMENFLNELTPKAAPQTGEELSQNALAMARQMGRNTQGDRETGTSARPTSNPKVVEPFSLEMYFDAFVRKLNRSAAFVKDEASVHGSRKALVEISLNSDGSLKSYRVLRSADQEAQIAYIKSVLERASPFSAFPPDIGNAGNSLPILMCIYPAHEGNSGGFSRSFGGQDCTD
jgi:hypothetical protein